VGQRVINVKVGVGMGVVVGGRAEVVRACEYDSEFVNLESVKVKEMVGSGVPDAESECVFLDLDSDISCEMVAVGSVLVWDSVGMRESENVGVFIDSVNVRGRLLVEVSSWVKVGDKAESVKEFVISAVSDLEAELAESVTSGVSEIESVKLLDKVRVFESVGWMESDGVGWMDSEKVRDTEGERVPEIEAETEKEKEGEGVKVSVFCERERVGGGEAVNVFPVSVSDTVIVSVLDSEPDFEGVGTGVIEYVAVTSSVGETVIVLVTESVGSAVPVSVSLSVADFVGVARLKVTVGVGGGVRDPEYVSVSDTEIEADSSPVSEKVADLVKERDFE
jgi:hypothetical protein